MYKGSVARYDRPFGIVQKVENVAYWLNFLETLKLHSTLHVSIIKPCHDDPMNTNRNKPGQVPSTLCKFSRVAERILDCRVQG